MRPDIISRRHEMILCFAVDHAVFTIGQVHVVIVIPGRNAIDHFITFINDGFENRIDQWPAARSDLDLIRRIIQAFPFFDETAYRGPQVENAFR
jgi:hypothetical protein